MTKKIPYAEFYIEADAILQAVVIVASLVPFLNWKNKRCLITLLKIRILFLVYAFGLAVWGITLLANEDWK